VQKETVLGPLGKEPLQSISTETTAEECISRGTNLWA